MKTLKLPTVLASALLVVGVISAGCVADRPSRNGVFNENQYLRKDFLIQGVDANGQATQQNDPGWLVRATVTETGTPNLIGNPSTFGVYPGEESDIQLVRFRVTQDSLQMLDQTQLSVPQNPGPAGGANFTGVTDTITNAWPATNVDLKYQVSLDGEKTNFYQENQELDWQVRQWVKLQFDKNDFSDLAPLGVNTVGLIAQCADRRHGHAGRRQLQRRGHGHGGPLGRLLRVHGAGRHRNEPERHHLPAGLRRPAPQRAAPGSHPGHGQPEVLLQARHARLGAHLQALRGRREGPHSRQVRPVAPDRVELG